MADTNDVAAFRKLIASRIRSEEREAALHEWDAYKTERQLAYVRRRQAKRKGKRGLWTKGAYVQSLTAPVIDLRSTTFEDVCVGYVDLRGARFDDTAFIPRQLPSCALKGARLRQASLTNAKLRGMRLMESDLCNADLSGADLTGADLSRSTLEGANLRGACLEDANLGYANLVGADVEGATLDRARVFGVAAWDLRGTPKSSRDLLVTPDDAESITTDDLRIAQFLYLMISNPAIRDLLDTLTRNVVLLLGRFRPDRKVVLEALKGALRSRKLVPVIFDFDVPSDRDITETVTLLARLARFIVADLTEPSSLPQELEAIAPHVAVPIRLIIHECHEPYAMSKDFLKYQWVIRPFRYRDPAHLLAQLETDVLQPVEAVRNAVANMRADADW